MESTIRTLPEKVRASSFRKILTASDVSTHGECGLPKTRVERTFSSLDLSHDSPSHDLVAKDLHGETWDFQHVYTDGDWNKCGMVISRHCWQEPKTRKPSM